MRKILTALLLALVIGAGWVALPSTSAQAAVNIPAAAHRGNWDDHKYPENSGNAFRYAQNHGVKYWETDLRFKADGTPVIHHDDADLALLTFAQFLNDLQVDYNVTAMVEFKEDPATHWSVIKNLLTQFGVSNRIIWTSFDANYLLEAETQTPSIPRGLIQSTGDTTPAVIAAAHVQWFIKHKDSFTWARVTNWLSGGNANLKLAAWGDTMDNNHAEYARLTSYTNMSLMIVNTPGDYMAWAATATKK